ncbi:MAG: alpha/beta hydrolase family protein [Planctomycetota bacterium]|jgi:dienelactone hydrolase
MTLRRLLRVVVVTMLAVAPAVARPGPEDGAPPPAGGLWQGWVAIGEDRLYVVLDVAPAGDDAPARITAPAALLLAAPVESVTADGADVAIVVRMGPRRLELRGALDGDALAGAAVRQAGDHPEEAGTFRLDRIPRVEDLSDPAVYTGEVEVQGVMTIGMTLVLAETDAGAPLVYLDIPAQGLDAFPLADVARADGTLTALLPGPMPARLELTPGAGATRLAGTLEQAGLSLEIDFPRDDDWAPRSLDRPQHPEPPFPYEARAVTVEHPDGHALAGTLTLPRDGGPHAAVVLITGSGPQDRDETVFAHKPFLVIADRLTRAGIAALRLDDRGTGDSTGRFGDATSADFATDVRAAVDFLAATPGIDAARIGLVGHSEGGLIAPMVAAESDDIAFIVLLAGPGVPGDELLRVQGEKIMRAGGAADAAVEEVRARQELVFRLVREEASAEEIRAAMEPVVEAQLAALAVDDPAAIEDALAEQLERLGSPWMRYFLTHDPRPALRRVRCPILACNGTLDLQVWHEQNLDEIARVVREAGGDVTVRRYEGLNHLFQPAETGGIDEYGRITTTMDEAVLADLAAWITSVTSPAAEKP